jgi:radical SAM protein with 4Fe4S-binding SPASM domain
MPASKNLISSLGPLEYGQQSERNPDNLRKVRSAFENRSEHNEGMPILLHVEASAECNLPCQLCPRGTGLIKRQGLLQWDDFLRVFTVLSPSLCNVIFSGWGEPLLNEDITKMIAHVSSHKIPVALNTNGVCLVNYATALVVAGLNTINISLDGAVSQATHAYLEDQPFESVADGLRKLRKSRDDLDVRYPVIQGQFILNEESIDEIGKLREWAFQLGADHVKFKRRHEIMPGQVTRNEQRQADDLRKINIHELVNSTENLEFSAKVCAHPWESIFLAASGNLSICSWDPHQKISLGRMPKDFNEIWNGKTVQMLRRWHAQTSTAVGEPCRTCNRLPGYLRFDDAVPS